MAVTEHVIRYRLEWGLYIKQHGVKHPICRMNEEGVRKSRQLLGHMKVEAPRIVEEARSVLSKARLQEAKKHKGSRGTLISG